MLDIEKDDGDEKGLFSPEWFIGFTNSYFDGLIDLY